jgi:hypothetical protein
VDAHNYDPQKPRSERELHRARNRVGADLEDLTTEELDSLHGFLLANAEAMRSTGDERLGAVFEEWASGVGWVRSWRVLAAEDLRDQMRDAEAKWMNRHLDES